MLNRVWAGISLLWIAWCLYWPFYARQQDTRAIDAELAQVYQLCVQQKGMTPVACQADRQAYRKFDINLAWPASRTVYQSFAGDNWSDAVSLLAVLCLVPITFGYVLTRALLALFFRATKRFTSAPASLVSQTNLPDFHPPAGTSLDIAERSHPQESPALAESISPDTKR